MKHFMNLLFVFVITLFGVSAFAVDTATTPVWDEDIYVEGNRADCMDASGQPLYPLNYNGSIYIPLRTAAEWMGKDVAQSMDGTTFSLSGNKEPVYHRNDRIDEKRASTAAVAVLLRAQLRLDGSTMDLTDAYGKAADIIVCGGEPYLPIRSVASTLGMSLKYTKETIYMRTPLTGEQLEACKAYADTLRSASREFTSLFGYDQSYIANLGQLSTAMRSIELSRSYAQTLRDEKRPDCKLLTGFYAEIDALADDIIKGCDLAEQLIQTNAPLEQVRDVMMLKNRIVKTGDETDSVMDSCLSMALVSNKISKVVYEM